VEVALHRRQIPCHLITIHTISPELVFASSSSGSNR
jgi:hypothetical protein